ncbi:MAG: PIN domain-containing protein [Acidobacteriota bacterium]|nr:PIN domain-containing protein [Acidobacteriota bacterium]
MKILLDNDVVLDFILKRPSLNIKAKQIFDCAGRGEIKIYISAITPINAFYTTRKEKGKDIAFKAVEGLLKLVEICRTDKSILQNAFALNFADYEDAVQHECAVAENLDAIVTRNVKDYKNSSIQIYSPTEFLQVL